MIRHITSDHRYAGLIAELLAPWYSRLYQRLRRRWIGGVWVLHDDDGWRHAKWHSRIDGFLTNTGADGCYASYHHTLITIVCIEDYT